MGDGALPLSAAPAHLHSGGRYRWLTSSPRAFRVRSSPPPAPLLCLVVSGLPARRASTPLMLARLKFSFIISYLSVGDCYGGTFSTAVENYRQKCGGLCQPHGGQLTRLGGRRAPARRSPGRCRAPCRWPWRQVANRCGHLCLRSRVRHQPISQHLPPLCAGPPLLTRDDGRLRHNRYLSKATLSPLMRPRSSPQAVARGTHRVRPCCGSSPAPAARGLSIKNPAPSRCTAMLAGLRALILRVCSPPAGALTTAIVKALRISFDMTRNMTIAASDFTLKLRDCESDLARAKWMTERDSFHHITAYDVSEIWFARNGNFGVSVGVIFMRILGAGMLLPRR